jgi:hypothetical protein
MANPQHHYEWLIYALVAFVYTMLQFGISFTNWSTPIFSNRNSRKPSFVVLAHLMFLAILMKFVWLAFYVYQSLYSALPDWMTINIRRGVTPLDLLFVLTVLAIGFIERRWIYVESNTLDPSPKDSEPENDSFERP